MNYPINHYNIRALLNTLYNIFHANYHLSNVSFQENKALGNSLGGKTGKWPEKVFSRAGDGE